VSSSGSISFFKLKITHLFGLGGIMGEIIHLNTFQVFPESTVVTSLAWHNSSNGPIAVTTSEGKVSILNFCDDYTVLHQHAVINTHGNYEAWTVAFAMDMDHLHAGAHGVYENSRLLRRNEYQGFVSPTQGVYSGGDDSRLRFAMFSRNKEGHIVTEATVPEATDRHGGTNGMGGHNAGVTAILPIPLSTFVGQDILITGSYDDHVRVYAVYDHRPFKDNKTPKILAELNIGGGVWRLTFLENYIEKDRSAEDHIRCETDVSTFRMLASCMQGGVRVLEVTGSLRGEWTIKAIAELKFNTANDLVYAGDVQPAGPRMPKDPDGEYDDDEEEFVFVSANFYEKQLCVWKYHKPPSPVSPNTSYLRSRKTLYGLDSTK
jgi:diphthine methyl ester acylhydrolase